jgi:putative aminopeptidase FrvX
MATKKTASKAKKSDSSDKKEKERKVPKFDTKSRNFLYKYLDNHSPVGYENSGQRIWLNYLKPYCDDTIVDTYGSAVAVINPGKKFKVVIEAHSDEIAWMVNYITDQGYIYVSALGGSDYMIAPSMRVTVHGEKGKVPGFFGWPAVHVRDRVKDEPPSAKNIFIDVGAKDKKEVEKMGIVVGSVVTFNDSLTEMNDKFLVGRALDNRLGGFVIAEVARRIHEKKIKLPYTLYVVNSVQEEIGLRGALMISRRLDPNAAICIDVTHDTHAPMYNRKDQGDHTCGKGPVVTIGPQIHKHLHKIIIDAAKNAKIDFQRATANYATGTDTDSFAYGWQGNASALLSIPLRYMHTTVETVHKNDVEDCINLYIEVLKSIKGNEDFRYV